VAELLVIGAMPPQDQAVARSMSPDRPAALRRIGYPNIEALGARIMRELAKMARTGRVSAPARRRRMA